MFVKMRGKNNSEVRTINKEVLAVATHPIEAVGNQRSNVVLDEALH